MTLVDRMRETQLLSELFCHHYYIVPVTTGVTLAAWIVLTLVFYKCMVK